jgi:hypothetical protein
LSPPESRASDASVELLSMVRTLADVKASMPRKLRGVINRVYGVNVEVNKVVGGDTHYMASSGGMMPDLRFTSKAGGRVLVHSYKPGDWELAVKRAHDDLVAQSGAFEGLSIKLPQPTSDIGKEAHPPGGKGPQKNKDFIGRLLGMFVED